MTEKRPLEWLGNSLDNLRDFPEQVQKDMGDDLLTVQWGGTPNSAKHFHGVGAGVYELVDNFNTDAYRAVYAVKLGRKVYVLHAFQKKSKKGIKTPQSDVELIKKRYNMALLDAKEEKNERKN